MENIEEIFDFQDAVFGEVRDMNSIFNFIYSEFGSDRTLFDESADLWVMGSGELSQLHNDILLSDFHNDAGSTGQLLSHLAEFG